MYTNMSVCLLYERERGVGGCGGGERKRRKVTDLIKYSKNFVMLTNQQRAIFGHRTNPVTDVT
jgi:hypothetical protein